MNAAVRYAPEFRIVIDGVTAPAALRASVTSVSLQTGLEGVDRVELTLANEGLRWLDHATIKLDRQLAVFLGYAPEPLKQMFVGEIVGHNASFPASGAPTLTVVAQDHRRRMQGANRVRWFAIPVSTYGNLPVPDGAIAAAVTAENAMVPIADPVAAALAILLGGVQIAIAFSEPAADRSDPDKAQKVIRKQVAESDFDFLARIARENGWEMLVDHEGSQGGYRLRFFSPADHLTPDVTLKWGRDLIEFTPRITTVGQIAGISIPIWIPAIKTELTVSVGWDWDRQSLDLSISPGIGMRASQKSAEGQFTLIGRPVTLADAPRTILGELLPRLNRRQTGSGSTVGNLRVRAGGVLQLEGLGERFGGLYRTTSVTHSIDTGGWRTSFDVRKEIWFGAIPLREQGAVPVQVSL